MIPSTQHLAASIVTLLLIPLAVGQVGCGLKRDDETCARKGITGEIMCLMEQNTLKTIMDCVQFKETKGDHLICREPDDRIDNNNEEYYFNDAGHPNQVCIVPRTIIIDGPKAWNKIEARKLGLGGAFLSCPVDDPDFHNCLCENKVTQSSLLALSRFFKVGVKSELSCGFQSKRTDFLGDFIEKRTPHLHARDTSDEILHESLDPEIDYFTIDEYGRPVYSDGITGYRLPYYDQYIMSGNAARRCYVHPEVNEIAECRTWILATPVTSALSVLPTKASYKKMYTPSASASITATVAPMVTEVPVESLVIQSAEVSQTGAPTAATGEGGSGRAYGEVAWRVMLKVVGLSAAFLVL